MTNLISGLERIRSKLTEYVPTRASDLGSGLALEEIEEVVRVLPFRLPSEVYELYQWRDGLFANFLFENYEFLSLKSAVYSYQEELAQAQADYPTIAELFQYRFPIFRRVDDIRFGKANATRTSVLDERFDRYISSFGKCLDDR